MTLGQSADLTGTSGPLARDGLFSCVIDNHPRLHLEALRWFACLTEVVGVEPARLFVHVVGPTNSEVLDYLRNQGVSVRPINRFDVRSPHCNKIAGALRLADDHPSGLVVLCDADTAVLADPRPLPIPANSIAGKTVDTPLPPVEVLTSVFKAAEVEMPPLVPLPWGPDQWTVRGNSNGGIYLIPGPLLPQVAAAWATWAAWLLDRSELLEEWTVYVDQVAMALGLAAEGINSHPLEVQWNTPTHDKTRIPEDPPRPAVLHYHQEVDPDGLIRPVGNSSIDGQIKVANAAVQRIWGKADPQVTQERWLAGTRQATQSIPLPDRQRALISTVQKALEGESVLEVEGDGVSVASGLDLPGYRRVERSAVPPEGALPADLTIGLGLLPFVQDEDEYRTILDSLWKSTNQAMIVEGYEDCFGALDPGTYFHEPVSTTLKSLAPDAEIYPIQAGSLTTLVALRPPTNPHPRFS